MALKLQMWMVKIEYTPGEANQLPYALPHQQWETDSMARRSGGGECGGPAPTDSKVKEDESREKSGEERRSSSQEEINYRTVDNHI